MEISINDETYYELMKDFQLLRGDKIIALINDGDNSFLTNEIRDKFYVIDDMDSYIISKTNDHIKSLSIDNTILQVIDSYLTEFITIISRRKSCKNPYILDAYYQTPLIRIACYKLQQINSSNTITNDTKDFIQRQISALFSAKKLMLCEVICGEHGLLYKSLINKIKYTGPSNPDYDPDVFNNIFNRFASISAEKKIGKD